MIPMLYLFIFMNGDANFCSQLQKQSRYFSDNLELEERNVTAEFLDTLNDIEEQFPKQFKEKEWTRRKQNLEENWASSRYMLLNCLLLKECIPDDNIGCSKCKKNVAILCCAACRELLCFECDTDVHNLHPFHDREMWQNGFYEGISNNHTVIDGALAPIGMLSG